MAFDPNSDIDEGGDQINARADLQDLQDQREQQQALPAARPVAAPTSAPALTPQAALTPSVRPIRQPAFNPSTWKPDEGGETIAFQPTKDTSSVKGSLTWKDYGDKVWASTLQAGASMLGAVDFVEKQVANDPTLQTWAGKGRDAANAHMQATLDGMTDRAKEVMSATILGYTPENWGLARGPNGEQVPTPGSVGWSGWATMNLLGMVPDALMMILPGGLVGRAAVKTAELAGVTTKAVEAGETAATLTRAGERAAAVGHATGTGLYFGTENAGQLFNSIHSEISSASDADLKAGSQYYTQLRDGGMSVDDAKATLTAKAAPFVYGAFAAGAVGGAGVGAAGGVAKGALTGAAAMGVQGGATAALQQGAENRAGTRQGYDYGSILADAVSSGVQGAVLGAVGGRGRGAEAAEPKPEPVPEVQPKPGVGTDETAALKDQLAPPATTGPRGTQGEMFSPQGEMFPGPGQMGQRPPEPAITGMQPGMPPGATQGDLLTEPPRPAPPPAPVQGEMFPRAAPAPPPEAPTAPTPPAAQAAIDASKGGPTPTPAPASTPTPAGPRPSEGMKRQALVDALTGQVDPKALKAMSRDDLAKRYDKLAPAPDVTTVVKGSEAAPAKEPPAPATEGAAPPPPSAGVGSLPVAGEAAAAPGTKASVPFMITQAMKQDLRARGHTDEYIRNMTPQQASDILAKPAVETLPPPKTAAAIAASKRAAAKAKMAEPGPPVRGAGEVATELREPVGVEAEAPAVEQARADRVGDLAEAVRAIPAPKGSALEATLRKAQRYLSEAIGKTDGSKDAIAELIHNWMEKEPTRYPGTPLTARLLGEHLMERVAGQKPIEREEIRSEITEARREDVARTGAESKTVTGESIEQAAAKRDEGAEGTSAITPVVKTEVPDTTDYRRIADNLIQKVLDREMTPAEASTRYGEPQKGVGAKRRWPRLADRLKDWITHAEDPAAEAKVLREIAETQNDKTLTPHQKSTATKKLERQLNRTGPEFAAELREHLQGMEDPVGHAADREAEKANLRAQMEARIAEHEGRAGPVEDAPLPPEPPAGIDPRSSRYVRMSQEPRINANYEQAFRASEKYDAPFMARDAAGVIANDPLVRNELGPLHEVATRLMSQVPPDIPIMSFERARAEGRISQALHDDLQHRGVYGAYDPESRTILQNINAERVTGTHVETALHEMVHAVSWHYLNQLERTNRNHPDLRALHAIRGELARHITQEQLAKTLTEGERQRLLKAIQNNHEMHTQLMTDPVVQAFAASRQASPALLDQLRNLGQAPTAGQSIWRSFANWVRKATGQRPARSASEYTLFDHIIKPVTDITDRAAEYNKRFLPQDPVLKARAEPLYDGAIQAAKDYADKTLAAGRREAPYLASSTMDRTRPKTLAITNMDQMVPRYRATFEPSDRLVMPAGNPLVRVRDAGEAIAHRAKQFLDKFTDDNNSLITRAKSLNPKRQDAIAQLLNDATVANVHLAGDNPHLITPEQKAAEAALKQRFAALSPAEQKIEQDFVNTHAAMDKVERQAKVEGILASVFPEATEAQRAEFSKITSSKDRLEKFLANPDTSDIAKEYGPAWDAKYGDLVKLSAKAIDAGWQRGDFVPLRRTGDYAIAYGERGTPSEGLEMFETRGQAEERYAQLARDPAIKDTLRNVDFTRENALRTEMRNNPLVEQLDSALRKRPDLAPKANEIRDLMDKLVLEAATRADGSRMRRRGIQGASLDFTRTLARETRDTSARVGYLAHGGERFSALQDMRDIADDLARHGAPGESRIARQVITEIEKHVTAQENTGGTSAAIARRAGTFGYMQSLASFSHLATATIENYSMAVPQLAARHGYGRTTVELGRVGRALVSPMFKTGAVNMMKALGNKLKAADWQLSDVMAKHLKDSGFNAGHVNAVFTMLKRAGLVDHSYARELQRLANPEGAKNMIGRGVDYFNNLLGVWSHSVDAMNRSNVAMSAFNLEFRKTGDTAKALAYAEEQARMASPNYNLANKNRFSTSAGPLKGLAGPATQFKQYGFFAYGVLGNAVKASLAKLPSEQRTEARRALAGMLATHALTAGLLGTPLADGLRYFGGLYDWMTNAKKPHDYQDDVRGFLADHLGPEMGELLSRGAIDTFTGASVHRRVSFANVLEIPPLESFDMPGVLKMVGTAAVGASGEDATKFANGLQSMLQGDLMGGLKLMIPRPIRDAMTANDLATKGVTTAAGRTILGPQQISPWDIAVQAAGFQPSRVSEAREGSAAVEQARSEAQAERDRLSHAWVQADPAGRSAIWQQIVQHNQDPNNLGFRIQMDQLQRDLQAQRRQAAQPGGFGLRLPRRGAGILEQAGAFANP